MEVFFTNLAPDETAAERLLRDLSNAEEGVEELFEAEGERIPAQSREKFLTHVEQLKAVCRRIQGKAVAGARAADRAAREHPYSLAGIAFGVGIVLGAIVLRRFENEA